MLRWIVELDRVDVCCEVSLLSLQLALPREGHLQQIYRCFAYLKARHNARLVLDPTFPQIDASALVVHDWGSFYGDVKEAIPPNAPKARGMKMIITVFVDADHAGDKVSRRSRTGFVVFLYGAPIYWMSKKQTSIETSTFGSEFVAMKQATEFVRGLQYCLRMMGIPVTNPAFVYVDNQLLLYNNVTLPSLTLKKKSNSIAYHFVREGCAMKEWICSYVRTHLNPSDILTKPKSAGNDRNRKVLGMMLHALNDDA